MANDTAFVTALVINSAVAVIFVVLFCILRPRHPKIYHSRHSMHPDLGVSVPMGVVRWAWDAWKMSDDDVYRMAGMDAAIYTAMFRHLFHIFFFCSFYGLLVLMPVNSSGQGGSTCVTSGATTTCTAASLTGLDSITLSNVPEQDSRLWAHLISAYVFVGIACFFLHRLYQVFIHYRLRFYSDGLPHCHSILIRDIPSACSTNATLLEHVKGVFGEDEVVAAQVATSTGKLGDIIAKRNTFVQKLDHFLAVKELDAIEEEEEKRKEQEEGGAAKKGGCGRKRGKKERKVKPAPQTRVGGKLCFGGKKVETEQHLKENVTSHNSTIKEHQDQLQTNPRGARSGFVTFKTIATAAKAHQALLSSTPFSWTVDPSPEPRDVKWSNVNMPFFSRYIRSWVMSIATFALVLFWAIPVTFVASLTTLQNLSDKLPFLEPVINLNVAVKGFLEGFLPTIALIVFMALLPMILTAMSTFEGIPAVSWINIAMMKKFFYFQVVNVFLISLIAGSAFNQLSSIIGSPTSIISILGESIPRTGFFFTNYVMLQALSSHTGVLLQIARLIVYGIKLRFLAKSHREKEAAALPPFVDYGKNMPKDLLVVLLGFVYATAAPIILPFAVLYFFIGYLVYRHNTVHVYNPIFESGGLYFPPAFNRIMASVVIYQITIIGILGLKKAPAQTILMLPLLLASIFFWSFKNKIFEQIGLVVSQQVAVTVEPIKDMEGNSFRVPELNASTTEGNDLVNGASALLAPPAASSNSRRGSKGADNTIVTHDVDDVMDEDDAQGRASASDVTVVNIQPAASQRSSGAAGESGTKDRAVAEDNLDAPILGGPGGSKRVSANATPWKE